MRTVVNSRLMLAVSFLWLGLTGCTTVSFTAQKATVSSATYSAPSMVWLADVKSCPTAQAAMPEIIKATQGDVGAVARAEKQLANIAADLKTSPVIRGAACYNLSVCALMRGDLKTAQQMSELSVQHSPELVRYATFADYLRRLQMEQHDNELSNKVDGCQQTLTNKLKDLENLVSEQQKALAKNAQIVMDSVGKKAETQQKELEVQLATARENAKKQAEQLLKDIGISADAKAKELLMVQATQAKNAQEKLAEQINSAYRIPAEIEPRLVALEKQGQAEELWPTDIAGMQKFLDELNSCIRAIPPLAERDVLPRINALRWEAQAMKAILDGPAKKDDADRAELIGLVLDAQPTGVPNVMIKKLENLKSDAEVNMAIVQKNKVLTAAKEAIEKKDGSDPAKAWDDLGYLVGSTAETDKEAADEAKKLRADLRIIVANKNAQEQLDALKTDMEKVKSLNNSQLKQIGYRQISATASGYLLSWLNTGVGDDKTDAMNELCKDAEKKGETIGKQISDEKYLAYQKWALNKIKKMQYTNDCYGEICAKHEKVKAGTGLLTKQKDIDQAQAREEVLAGDCGYGYGELHMAAKNCLVPINMGMLDPGVLQMYQRVWKETQDKLEKWMVGDEKAQEWLAKQAATVPKKGLTDDLSE